MDKREFDLKVKEIHEEVDRLSSIVEDPARILSEFYDAYKPNLLQKTLEFLGYAEDELYEVLIQQIGKLPALANCKITRASDKPLSPLRICYRDPQFELMVIDIKAHRYESTYESVANGLRYRLRDAEKQQKTAEDNVKEMRELESRVRTICAGEIPLKKTSFNKRGALKRYLTGLGWYTREDATRACDNTEGFLRNIQEEIDKRQSILAETQQEYSACAAAKKSFEDNPYLQNAVKDLTELLQKSGYISRQNLMYTEEAKGGSDN